VRLGIVSDIHCNIASLDMALERMGPVDEVLCAGDAVFQFRFSNEVVSRLREVGARVVLGNHEEILLSRQGERACAQPDVDQDLLKWLSGQPDRIDTVVGGKRLTMFHGSHRACGEYVYPHNALMREFGDLGADYVVHGHTHCAMSRRVGDTLVINPGSAGQPRDPKNGFRSSYAVLDTQSGEVAIDVYDDPVHKPNDVTL
jgi:putative phosphoesterase